MRATTPYSAAAIVARGVTMVTMASALSAATSGSRLSCSKLRVPHGRPSGNCPPRWHGHIAQVNGLGFVVDERFTLFGRVVAATGHDPGGGEQDGA
jgi:hypothetical protein